MRRAGVLSLTLLTTGCFDYREVAVTPSLATGGIVRVELTDNGTTDLTKSLGPYVTILEGPVRSTDQDGLTLGVNTLRRRGEGQIDWTGDTVRIARTDIRYLTQRTPSRGKTGVAVATLAAAGVALIVTIARATGLVSGSSNRPPISTP
jgi:hypothetical protein